jgi:hypothetical protein
LQDALLEHFDGKLQSLVRIADGTSGLSFIGNLDGQRRFFKTYPNESGRDSLLRECTILEMVSPQLEPHHIKLDQSAVSRIWLHTKVLDAAVAATPKEIIGLIHNYQVQLEKCDLTTVDLSRAPNITYLVTEAELALAELAEGNFLAASTMDVVRSSIPRMDLDEAFASKDEVANAVKSQLAALMSDYGYEIIAALVIDLDPNTHVKAAMNDIIG